MRSINPQEKFEELVGFIKEVCHKEKISDVLLGVSGGVDSATSLALSVRALGTSHVFPVLLPYGELSDQGTKDARLLLSHLKIPESQIQIIDIKLLVDALMTLDPLMDEGRKGNVMARMRMVVLFDLAKKHNYLVLGTENKTEHLLGYYTRFGDEASDLEPLSELYKFQVYELAEYLEVPEEIITKDPTAGLWEGQTDEKEFGFSYKTADEILYLYSEEKLSKKDIVDKGFDKEIVDRVWWWIDKGFLKDRLPYTP